LALLRSRKIIFCAAICNFHPIFQITQQRNRNSGFKVLFFHNILSLSPEILSVRQLFVRQCLFFWLSLIANSIYSGGYSGGGGSYGGGRGGGGYGGGGY
jgi:hypothetical protein